MLDKTKNLIGFGFLVILALMLALTVVSLTQINNVNAELEKVVEINNIKISSAHAMRDAIHKRAMILRNARLTEDPFEVDDYSLSFYQEAGKYRKARLKLIALGMDEKEEFLHHQLSETTILAQPLNDRAMSLLIEGGQDKEVIPAMQAAAEWQQAILSLLDDLIALEELYAQQAVDSANASYLKTRDVVLLIFGTVLLISIVISVAVIRLAARNTRQIHYQASHDPLTGLVNRREFEHVLTERINADDNRQHALLFMDLDDFKVVNDSCGHAAGDQLLKDLSLALLATVRQSDMLARVGGDEFGVLLHGCSMESAYEIAEKIRHKIADFPFQWEGEQFSIGVSIGLAMIDGITRDISQLLKDADSACYTAKDTGRNRVCIYQQDNSEILRREHEISWVGRIKDAIFKNQLLLYIQPIQHLPSSEITHHEICCACWIVMASRYCRLTFYPRQKSFI